MYLKTVVEGILKEHKDLENLVFILPSNRAVRMCQKIMATTLKTPVFAPKAISTQSFIQELSLLELIEESELYLLLYECYTKQVGSEADDFTSFTAWATFLLGDFNEIDRHLIPSQHLFDQLTSIAKLNEWGKGLDSTELLSTYIKFSKSLYPIYLQLRELLLKKGKGYQGMLYRKAVENLPYYLKNNKDKTHFFIGLNALTEAEKQLVHTIVSETGSNIYWDLDNYFLQDPVHDASLFIRQIKRQWGSIEHKMVFTGENQILSPKKIQITGLVNNQLQVQLLGKLVQELDVEYQPTALVLADESLLPLVLSTLPVPIDSINITMGFDLKSTNIARFIMALLKAQELTTQKGWYHKDIVNIVSHPSAQLFFGHGTVSRFKALVRKNNLVYVSKSFLDGHLKRANTALFQVLIADCSAQERIRLLIEALKTAIGQQLFKYSGLEKEAAHLLQTLLEEALTRCPEYKFLNTDKALTTLIAQLMDKERITLKGNPDSNFQIMGVLETRGLDFENVIIASLNEGVLPAGKSSGSFIPYDVKKAFNLPSTKEKDAIYAYHFYRLIQRAKTVHLCYTTAADVLVGGEKSRFILQLEADPNIARYISSTTIAPLVPSRLKKAKQIHKTKPLLADVKRYAAKGFSPSALSTYIADPYEFYKRYILKIDDAPLVNDQMPHNVLGTIVHDSLEAIYTPFLNEFLDPQMLKKAQSLVADQVLVQFEEHYPKKSVMQGRNLIAYNVIQHYVSSVLEHDSKISEKQEIKIISLEEDCHFNLSVPNHQNILLRGKLDRIDHVDGVLRIVDYKTGTVLPSDLKVDAVDRLFSNKKYNKAFQLLCYALLAKKGLGKTVHTAEIMPIKSMKNGSVPLFFKATKTSGISEASLMEFEQGLVCLIGDELLNPDVPFSESL